MWREEGKGELYTYLPPSFPANDKVCSIPPYSECNPAYGASVGRGSWYFTPGRWVTVAERVRLNDAGPGEDGGAQNAEIEVFADGVSVVSVSGLVLRRSNQGLFRGIMVQSFFGGENPRPFLSLGGALMKIFYRFASRMGGPQGLDRLLRGFLRRHHAILLSVPVYLIL